MYTTRVNREITSTVTVTESIETTPTAASSSGNLPAPEFNTTVAGDAGEESSVWVQTTGVSQGTPSYPEASATESTTPPTADPTAPPFTCPEDDGRTISQMLGTERFDYDVYCDKDLPSSSETDIPLGLSYDSFSQCVAACSLSNMQFPGGPPVCQGVAYFEAEGNNCILKSAANATDSIEALGVDIAILKRIAVGVDEDNADGTNTETVTPDEPIPTYNPSELGSMLGAAMGNSTTTVPIYPPAIITGRPAMDGVTPCSTYISDGQTYSTGSVFSTYFSGNGSWYYSYFSAWSLAWTDAQTIYAAGETTIPVAVNNTGVTEQHNGANGEYSIITTSNTTYITYQANQTIYDTTELIGNNTYDANGTQIFETTTTSFYTYTMAAEGADGGNGGGDAGVITSTAVSQFSAQSVIYSSGATGGQIGGQGSGGQVIQTPGPTLTSTSAFSTQTVIVSSGGLAGGEGSQGGGAVGSTAPEVGVTSTITSAFSTQIVVTNAGNTAGGEGGEGSGGQGSVVPITIGSSVILVTGGTVFSTGGVASGGGPINGTSGATGAVGSGAVESNAPITSTITGATVIVSTGGTGGFFSTAAQGSGAGGETSGATSTGGAGFTNSQRPRSGTDSDSTSFPATENLPSLTVPAPFPPGSTVSSGNTTSLNVTLPLPTGTPSGSFSNSGRPRSGTESLTSDFGTGTGLVPYPPLSTSPSSGVLPPTNASLPVPTGTSPGSFTNSLASRSGTTSIPPVSLPSPITVSFPTGTGPVEYPPIIQTLSFPTVTGPIPYPPLSTGPSASVPVGTGPVPYPPLSSAPSASIPASNSSRPSSSSGTFSNTNKPRSGTERTSTQSVTSRPPVIQTLPFPTPSNTRSSIALSTGGPFNGTSIPFPTGTAPPATSCPSQTVSTITLWATTTLLGCFDKCPPGGSGGYGPGFGDGKYQGPQSFGPPAAIFAPTLSGDPNPPPTSPAETSG